MSGLVPYDELQGRFDDYYTPLHAAHFVTEQMLALTTFIAYGILERHPRLRVAFLETGAVWALSYLHRLDEHLELFGFDRGGLTMEPSDYFRRQCFVSVEEVEPGLATMVAAYPDSVVFASDYPHADGTFPGSTKELLGADRARRRRRCAASCATTRFGSTDWPDDDARDERVRRDQRPAGDTRLHGPRRSPTTCSREILTAATRACSSGNTQPWEFVRRHRSRGEGAAADDAVEAAWVTVDAQRAQSPEQLVDGVGPARHRSRGDREHRPRRRDRVRVLEPRPRRSA